MHSTNIRLINTVTRQIRFYSSHNVVLVVGGRKGIGNGLVEQLETRAKKNNNKLDVIATSSQFTSFESETVTDNITKHLIPLDLYKKETFKEASEYVKSKFGKLDMLINCIGVLHGKLNEKDYFPEKTFLGIDEEWMIENFRVNTVPTALLAKNFCDILASKESENNNHAVFATLSARIGSIGDNRLGGWYSYRVSKAAEHQFIKTLSIELARKYSNPRYRNVISVCLHPGTVESDLSAPFKKGVKPEKLFTPEFSANKLLTVIDSINEESNGKIFDWAGEEIPY